MTIAESPLPLTIEFQSHQIRKILDKCLRSKLNISPKALLYLVQLNITEQELMELLEKIAYSDRSSSYIDFKTVKRLYEKGELSINNNKFCEDNSTLSKKKVKSQETNIKKEKYDKKKKEESKIITNNKNEIMKERNQTFKQISQQKIYQQNNSQQNNSQLGIYKNKFLNNLYNGTEKTIKNNPQKIDLKDNIKEKTEFNTNSMAPRPETDEERRVREIREKKRKSWESIIQSRRIKSSSNTFKPIASEYPADIKIIKDPTGKLYSEGKIDDFLKVQRDKFEKLKNILSKRPEGVGLLDISLINRLENPVEVKFVGMVMDKRQTPNKHYILTMEDPTGLTKVLVRQSDDPTSPYNLMNYLLPDHVVIIDGYLSINRERNSRIIMANKVIFPDTPKSHTISFPEEDIAVCLISDTHFGSKDWLEKVWHRFVKYLNCELGNDSQQEQAGKIKYLTIAGDLVDGIGVYPNQDKRLSITDIYKQYEVTAKYLSEIPDYIQIIISPGDHDAVRKAIPTPSIPKSFAPDLYNMGVKMVGTPAYVSLHGIKTLLFHGTSLIDMNMSIPGLKNEDPFGTMKEFIRARHLAPTFGKKTEIAPTELDWLVMDPIPDIFHTGHLHKNGIGRYNGILTVNSGCFQAQTDYMKSFGIDPDYGKPTIVNLKGPQLKSKVIDLVGDD